METINSMATAAAKAVWGENKTEEPVSGKTGDVTKGEPYDAGNLDEPNSTRDSTTNTTTTAKPESVEYAKTTGIAEEPESAPNNPSANLKSTSTPTKPESVEHAKTTGIAKEPESAPNNPSANLKSTSIPADTTKGQNDTRDPEDPQTHPKGGPTDVDDTGDGPNEAQKLDGPGPRPLEEVAREHGGDAGRGDKIASKSDSAPGAATGAAAGGAAAGGAAAGGAAGNNEEINEKSTGEGTGEKYVKSSGLKVDGGDFDATHPGAGREADRLLDQKGIPNPTETAKKDAATATPSTGTSDDKDKEKVSLKDKIKAKLHKH